MEVGRRRTRMQWAVYYKQLHHEKKKNNVDDVVETSKRDADDGNGVECLGESVVKKKNNDGGEVVKKNDGMDVDGDGVQVLEISGEDDDGSSIECWRPSSVKHKNDADVDEALKSEDVDVDVDVDDVNSVKFVGASTEKQMNDDVVNVDDDVDVDDGVNDDDDDEDYDDEEDEEENSIDLVSASSHLKVGDLSEGVGDASRGKVGAELETDEEEEELPNVKKKKQKRDGAVETHKSMESASSTDNANDEGSYLYKRVKIKGDQCSVKKVMVGKKRSHSARGLDFIEILVDSMNLFKEKQYNIDENALAENALPLRFRFEDEVVPPSAKSEWEEHIDSLFREMELGLREIEADCTNLDAMENDDLETNVEIDESPAACCCRGKHHAILDEQIGIVCKYCHTVIMGIKHVLPPFHVPTWGSRDRRYYRDEFPSSFFSEIEFGAPPSSTPDSTSCIKGTVWDLVPGVEKEMYPHQREGFEFMWRNIAGDIMIEKLRQALAEDARGCIISHAPGTGKTRLTIVFLQTFMKLYPACSPLIIAPRGMLLTWEAEFKKWNFNVAFHNLNTKELSGKENTVATELLGQAGSEALNIDDVRLLKLYSWARGGSILGIGYPLFERLAGYNGKKQQHEKIREVLLERPGLLVLDEGHTPRNDESQIWKALTKVSTQRRIILSGTPFQNNLRELYNTLCVVNPKFADQEVCHRSSTRAKWRNLTNSGGVSKGQALKLRAILDPYIHVYKGTVLEESLPGLRHTLVFLHPTNSQKALLESACEEKDMFRRIRMVSLVSLHPSIKAVTERYSTRREDITMDIDAGVKSRFIFKLIHFADALGERVLIFSQFLDSLVFIKEQLDSIFSWREGREVLYMHGKLDEKKRQESISCFNDVSSEAKVLLASVKACSEGINLIGGSRVVLLDTVWNPSVEKQAISRAYRLGQKRVVYVYRLFTSGIEVRQYAHQNLKERISQWIFSLGEGHSEKAQAVPEDEVLEAMRNLENFNRIFEKVIVQPKQSDLIKTFGLQEQK